MDYEPGNGLEWEHSKPGSSVWKRSLWLCSWPYDDLMMSWKICLKCLAASALSCGIFHFVARSIVSWPDFILGFTISAPQAFHILTKTDGDISQAPWQALLVALPCLAVFAVGDHNSCIISSFANGKGPVSALHHSGCGLCGKGETYRATPACKCCD